MSFEYVLDPNPENSMRNRTTKRKMATKTATFIFEEIVFKRDNFSGCQINRGL